MNKIFKIDGQAISFCEEHAFYNQGIKNWKWGEAPTTSMQCEECKAEASPATTYAHLNNDGYNVFIKDVARYLAKHVDDKQKVFLADAMSTFWPQMFLWGLYYSQTVKAETASGMLYHLLFEQEATQPLWDTLTEDF